MGDRLPRRNITAEHDPHALVASLGSTLIPVAVGLVAFLVTELMHYLLVPDLGRLWERLLAEGLSAVVVSLLTAGLIHQANRRREAALLRMQVIAEMNHHIRNALAAISLSTDAIQKPAKHSSDLTECRSNHVGSTGSIAEKPTVTRRRSTTSVLFRAISRERPTTRDVGISTTVNGAMSKWVTHT
jgi:signal transduction histidine kinase